MDEPKNVRPCLPPEEKFQRIRYEHADSSCVGAGLGNDSNPNFQKSSLSAAEMHQHAYQKGFADGKKQGTIDGEKKGFELAGVYHSHPTSPARPSQEDIKLAYDPDLSYVIVSLADWENPLKSFRIRDSQVEPEEIEIVDGIL